MPYEIVSHFTNPGTIMEVMGLSYNRVVDTGSSVLGSIINEISNQLKEDQVTVKPLWNEGPGIAEEIVKYTSNSSPDLVVITSVLDVTSKPKYIGPHTQKIIHCSKAPVLTIKKMECLRLSNLLTVLQKKVPKNRNLLFCVEKTNSTYEITMKHNLPN